MKENKTRSYDRSGMMGVVENLYRKQDPDSLRDINDSLRKLPQDSLDSVADALFRQVYESREDLTPRERKIYAQLLAYASGAVDGKVRYKDTLGDLFDIHPVVAKQIKDEGWKTLRSDAMREFLRNLVQDKQLQEKTNLSPTEAMAAWQNLFREPE